MVAGVGKLYTRVVWRRGDR